MSRSRPRRDQHVNVAALTPYTPYITSWSEEQETGSTIVERPGLGIGYLNERLYDRDQHGVLWARSLMRPGLGEPRFGMVHPLRQRRAMRRLLCNVCGGPADRTDHGVLWLLSDHQDDWPHWPERMGANEPPVCLPCVRTASRLCPALRTGAIAVRARHYPVAGVTGMRYRATSSPWPLPMGHATVAYTDPARRWILASKLVRELRDCTVIPLETLCPN